MSRNEMSKDELKVRVLKLKHKLYEDQVNQLITNPKVLAHKYLDEVLNIIDEYRV